MFLITGIIFSLFGFYITLSVLLDKIASQIKMIPIIRSKLLYYLKNDNVNFSVFRPTDSAAAVTTVGT